MDYGKIAYYKTQELERQASGKASVRYDGVTLPIGRVPGERLQLAELSGSGLIIVRVLSSGGRVRLYADSALIAEGEGDFTVSVPAGPCELYISSLRAVIESVQITAAGPGVSLHAAEAKLRADSDGAAAAALDCEGGVLTLYTQSGGGFAAAITYGSGGDYDIAAADGIYIAYNQTDSRTRIIRYNQCLCAEASCEFDLSAKFIGITAYKGGAALAYYAAGAVSVMLLDASLDIYDDVKAHISPSVTAVAFVKGGEELTLVINDGGDCLIRIAE